MKQEHVSSAPASAEEGHFPIPAYDSFTPPQAAAPLPTYRNSGLRPDKDHRTDQVCLFQRLTPSHLYHPPNTCRSIPYL